MIINNQLQLESYNEDLKKYILYASGKPKEFWGRFFCTFKK
jgi:hypothetical protein